MKDGSSNFLKFFDSDRWSRGQAAFIFNIPAIVFVGFFILYPIVFALILSFKQATVRQLMLGTTRFVGPTHFLELFKDGLFLTSLQNTLVFAVLSVSLQMALGLILALVIVKRATKMSAFTKTIMLIPWAVPPVVNGFLWRFLFSSKYGLINGVLLNLHLISDPIKWTTKPFLALLAVVIAFVWRTVPFCTLLFYAALQRIPEQLYEASRVDGASSWEIFRWVTLPLLKPTVLVLLILRTMFAFRVFAEIFSLTYGGPGSSTWVLSWYTYSQAFRYGRFGFASASGYILFLMTAVMAFVYITFLYERVEY